MSLNSNEFTHDVVVQDEIDRMKAAAPDYRIGTTCEFRTIISNACRDTYFGRRSIANFAEVAVPMIKQQQEFEAFEIPVKDLYFNSIKTWESQWEALRESQTQSPEKALKYKKSTENLAGMINALLASEVITTGDCKIHLTVQLMFECGIINNVKLFERRLVRLNTAMLYKQDKYNLVREVGEGYASLFNELTNASIDNARDSKGKLESTPMERIPQFLKTITSHMGVFHLDPNRVLDIILDLFIRQLKVNHKFWIALIKESEWVKSLVHTDLNGELVTNPSPIMAQLFGFRFHSYHNEDTEDTPKEIYFAIAILLANDLILLGDILPYLYPYHEGMYIEKKEYIEHMNKEINTNSGGQLATYGALGETEGSTVRMKRQKQEDEAEEKEEEEETKKKYSQNDVVELVRALLSIGDLKHAHMILAEYEKLVDLYPELAYDIYRLCSIVLDPAYEAFVPEETKSLYRHFHDCADQSQIKTALSTQDDPNPKIPDQTKLKRVLVFDALLDNTKDIIKRERYVFFYKDTRDGLDLCTEPEHLMTRFLPLARLAGYKTYLCTELVQKVMLIVGSLVERESEFPNSRTYCTNLLREFLLPSIAFSQGNPGTMASVWEILCRFTFQERYALYGEWHADFYKKTIETKLLKVRTERSIREVMRCVNKNNVRPSGRDLGKLAHSNPTLVFHHMLDQVQQFENLAPLMAEACRYYGDFAYDVLGFVLTEKWTGSQGPGRTVKAKEKDDGFAHLWFRSLAIFTGMLFKKQDMEATPLLRYLACRLRYDDSVSDLHLLNEFVTKMGGIEILASALTDDQIAAASCSETIKNEAFLPVSSDNRRASRRVLSRLKESLRKNNIGFEILVLLYRLDEVCSAEVGVPAAVRCHKLDHVHQSQIQYFELLTSLFEGDDYNAIIPEPESLIKDYQLPLDVVMNFTRPKTQHVIRSSIQEPVVEGAIWTPFQSLCQAITPALPEPPLGTIFSAEFYVVFWQLTLYDIYCPEEPYESAIKRETDVIRKCQDTRSQFYLNNRPSVVLKTQRQAQLRLDQLREDLTKHKAHVEKMMSVLKESKSRWFPSLNQRQAQISSIMQYCLLPRSRQSEVDAAFCYEFTMLMHRINTPNFSSLTLFDKMLSDNLPASFLAFSEYETTVYSRFIFKALSRMQKWHADEKLYAKEAHGNNLIGFQKNWNSTPTPIAKEDLLSFADFQRVLHKWHFKSDLVIEQALKSGEVVVMKNAFMVLRQFAPCFPAVADHGNSIMKIVKKLAEEDERGNIKVLARSYMGLIAKYKTKWISKEAFLGLKQPSPPVEIKIVPTGNTKETNSSSKDKSSNHHDSSRREESSSKKRDESAAVESKSSRPVSPSNTRRNDDTGRSKSSQRATSPSKSSPPPTDRKRTRDTEPSSSSRGEKMARIEENGTSRHHHRSSSRRESPRESVNSSSRLNTPVRNENRSSRNDPAPSSATATATVVVAQTTQTTSRSSTHRESSRVVDERSSRGRAVESNSSNRAAPSSTNQNTAANSSSKRPVDADVRDRVREERPEKRRDLREESRTVRESANSAPTAAAPTSSTSRSRLDESRRGEDRARERRVDDRRADDRRLDDRRMDDRRMDERRMDERRIDDRRLDDRRMDDRRMDDRRLDDRRRERDRDRDHRHRRR
ncbi:THO complex subunit 2 [Choanephora cucurbitarum]|uniref:THO complex subunit 2 n=1 Tax=Choanephora cucurbitarum TaxID=101091 RepID=A0A1C7N2W6_9FUNG|nr:THO complex subunit 2 [Choanephora cucurbitarum]